MTNFLLYLLIHPVIAVHLIIIWFIADRRCSSPSTIATDNSPPTQLEHTDDGLNREKRSLKLFKGAKNNAKRLIVILENANLDVVKADDNQYSLLNCDDHMNIIRKNRKDPAFCRPDILHQCLLMLMDSPLNRAGLLQVYVHSMQNVLIEVNPQTRIPRTFPRFAGLFVQLLHKLQIKAVGTSTPLLKVIKNPITAHVPPCRKVLMTFQSKNLLKPVELVPKDDEPIAVVIGAMAHGQVNVDYADEEASISQYPLSAALACTKIVSSFEDAWGIH